MKEQKRKNYTLVVEFFKLEKIETGSFLFPKLEHVLTTKTLKENLSLTKAERDNKEQIMNRAYAMMHRAMEYGRIKSILLVRNYLNFNTEEQ